MEAAHHNRLFIILAIAFTLGFFTQLAGGVYFVIHTNDAASKICRTANENRKVVTDILDQSIRRAEKGQFFPVELRDAAHPKQDGSKILLFIPPNKDSLESLEEAKATAAPINCNDAQL